MKATASELGWWALILRRGMTRQPGPMLVALALLWWIAPHVSVALWLLLALAIGGARFWARRSPVVWARWVGGPARSLVWPLAFRYRWPEVASSTGLYGERRLRSGEHDAPRLMSLRARWPRVRAVIRPPVGRSIIDFEKAAEAIRTAYGATQLRLEPHGPRDVLLVLTIGDALSVPFDADVPSSTTALEVGSVPLGRTETGGTWRLPIGPHTLVAGCSGAGKGSVFWSFAFGLAAASHNGVVQLHGIDLKGGMEILMGERLFTTCATTAAEAVVVLERLVAEMRARTAAYAGLVRSHAPTVNEPLHVVMIDELAALTAYCSERDLQRRAEVAINLLCSQGRAPGFMVFACLQDPRKEVIPSRGLFTQMIGLRLKDLSETTMVLGEQAVVSGAHCHRITRGTPGTGYVLPEEGGHPIRVRAGYASDAAIRAAAGRFPAAVRRAPLEEITS